MDLIILTSVTKYPREYNSDLRYGAEITDRHTTFTYKKIYITREEYLFIIKVTCTFANVEDVYTLINKISTVTSKPTHTNPHTIHDIFS